MVISQNSALSSTFNISIGLPEFHKQTNKAERKEQQFSCQN